MARLEAVLQNNPSLRDYARSKLLSFVLSVTDEDDLLQMIATGFSRASFSLNGTAPARELFAAIAARWLMISDAVFAEYETLIADHAHEEPAFQAFFTKNPQVLDPMAAEIWPEPDLHGALVPDFVIRRFDKQLCRC